jgi:hypothetical protein
MKFINAERESRKDSFAEAEDGNKANLERNSTIIFSNDLDCQYNKEDSYNFLGFYHVKFCGAVSESNCLSRVQE